MANDKGGNKGNISDSFNKKANQQKSDSQTLTGDYLKNAKSNDVKKNLYQVQETYHKKKNEFLLDQKIQKENFLKGKPQNVPAPKGAIKRKLPTQDQIKEYKAKEIQDRQIFENKWQNKAKMASEGKEWRDEKLKKTTSKDKLEQRKQITAKFNEQQKKAKEQKPKQPVAKVTQKEEQKQKTPNSAQDAQKQQRIEALKTKFNKQAQRSPNPPSQNKGSKKR